MPSPAIGEFVIGQSPIGGNVFLTDIVPSYAYTEYADDDDIQAFIAAWNQIAQAYLSYMVSLNLPIYTAPQIAGPLLDWVAQGIYGIKRPTLTSESNSRTLGPYNSNTFNTLPPLNTLITAPPVTFYATSDDIFKRIITWNFYKGDGFQYSMTWLKRRIARFLTGVNGTDPGIGQTYDVAVSVSNGAFSITIPSGGVAQQFKDCLNAGALPLPLQYSYSVTF